MTSLATEFAGSAGTVACTVAFDTTQVASAGERALNLGVGAIGFVVTACNQRPQLDASISVYLPNLAAVEALASQTAALWLVRAVAREVTHLIATTICQSFNRREHVDSTHTCDKSCLRCRHLRYHQNHHCQHPRNRRQRSQHRCWLHRSRYCRFRYQCHRRNPRHHHLSICIRGLQ